MSSFFDDASLVTIPSGYKDGKVYSVKPTSGAGDLTFTRNSNATRVDADGLVEKVRTNSLLRSQQIDDPYWSSNRASISANTTDTLDPFGANNAEKITQLSGFTTAPNFNRGSIAGAGTYTASIFAKKGTFNFIGFAFDGVTYFNLNNGTIGTTASGHIAKIEDYGNEWYRCSVAKNLTATTAYAIYPCSTDGTLTTPDNEDYAYLFGAQLEQGLVATSYIETTTTAMSEFAGVTASSVADVPRLDYSGGATCPSLLLEPQATALNLYSEQLDNAAWTKANLTATANQTASPTGYTDANKLSEQAVNGIHYAGQSIASAAAGTYTFSCFLKQGTTQYGGFRAVVNGFTNRYFVLLDLSNGTVVDTNTTASGVTWTHKVDTYTNGWYRLSITATHTSGNIDISISTSDTNSPSYFGSLPTYLGTNKYIYAWGANITSASYLQSYIPTYGTTVTRLADSTYVQNLITNGVTTSGGAYTIFFDLSNEPVLNVADGNSEFITLYSGQNLSTATISPRKYYNEADGKIRFYSNVDASNIGYVTSTNKKYAMSVNNNVVKLYSDGALQLTYTGTGNHNTLGSYRLAYGASNRTQAQFSQYIVFDSVLSDTECENLTA